MNPVYEPPDASPSLRLTSRLGGLRHHRADAHRAAWRAAGLTVDELLAMPDRPAPVSSPMWTIGRDRWIGRPS